MRRWPYILVVDDDADFRTGLRMALEMKGYQVEESANGEEALARLAERPPLLVLLDLQMPVMNGREMLQRMRATPELKDLPVVIISGFGFEWEAELMGAQGYIGKPFEPQELEATIANLLRPRLVTSLSSPVKPGEKIGSLTPRRAAPAPLLRARRSAPGRDRRTACGATAASRPA